MNRSNFLNADEMAIFRCDDERGGECFIARGPARYATDAMDRAFKGYDNDTCHSVLPLDTASGKFEDVTSDLIWELQDSELVKDYMSGEGNGELPAFMMTHFRNQSWVTTRNPS